MYKYEQIISKIRPASQNARREAAAYIDSLVKPPGSLGKLEQLAIDIAGMAAYADQNQRLVKLEKSQANSDDIIGDELYGKRNQSPEESASETGGIPWTVLRSRMKKRTVIVMCADNGVYEESVSAAPQETTLLLARAMAKGKSGMTVLAREAGSDYVLVDIGINCDGTPKGLLNRKITKGTANIAKGPAMTRQMCARAIDTGIEIVEMLKEKGFCIVGTGELGMANTTTAACVLLALAGLDAGRAVGKEASLDAGRAIRKGTDLDVGKTVSIEASLDAGRAVRKGTDLDVGKTVSIEASLDAGKVAGIEAGLDADRAVGKGAGLDAGKAVGKGAGLTEKAYENKKSVVRRALAANKPDANDPLDVLSKVGGFDIAGLVGVYLGAAYCSMPVVIDGFISAVAAMAAFRLCPASADFMIASHASAEPGFAFAMQEIGKEPMLYMDMRLGEGSGCPLAFHLIDSALAMAEGMATFAEASVNGGTLVDLR